jgi:hypothetical protein
MTNRAFTFYKNDNLEWFLDLPDWKGDKQDLQMVEGADEWLNMLSMNASKITLFMSDENFKDASILTLLHVREKNLGGGGNYYLETYQDKKVSIKLWLCHVTEFVFGSIPQRIYFLK